MSRAKNVLTALKNTNNNNDRKVILGATIINNANDVIAGAIINNGVITLNGVNITGARVDVDHNNRIINDANAVIIGAVVNAAGVIDLNGVNITGARVNGDT